MRDDMRAALHAVRRWLGPFVLLFAGVQLLVQVSEHLAGRPFELGAYTSIQFVLNTNASALASTLGILIALVLFVVTLSAQRYSFNIIGVFARNRVNHVMFSLYIVTITFNLWLSSVLDDGFIPVAGTLLAMVLCLVCFSVLVPYFGYLFDSLSPNRLLDQLQRDIFQALDAARRGQRLDLARQVAAGKIQSLGDVCRTAISLSDADVARHSIWVLHGTLTHYLEIKGSLPRGWFVVEDRFFKGRHSLILREIEETGTWFERRVLEQMQDAFHNSLNRIETVNTTVALCARLAAERALERDDDAVQFLLVIFFNTFLRAALNSRDARAGYHLLYQYDLFADAAFERRPDRALEIAHRIAYYGETALSMGVLWMAIAAANDLRTLVGAARQRGLPTEVRQQVILELLALTRHAMARQSPATDLIVKAALAVGAQLLFDGDDDLAGELAAGLTVCAPAQLARLAGELRAVVVARFWEVTDRVLNFDYVEDGPRARLDDFVALVARQANGALPVESLPSSIRETRGNR
ncbi:MAG: DUF2254 domain-containing protein [Chloroflexi bacterium]|nr:DUF2254 domain-containing protein [Chloroflexota bacterium]